LPTELQALRSLDLCQRITNLFLPIYIVRFDQRSNQVFILAGEETEILINPNGNWDYVQ
jgi:hypothetical protein